MKKNNEGQVRIFNNRILQSISKGSRASAIITYLIIVIIFLSISYYLQALSLSQSIIIYSIGIFTWTLFEYLIHRFAFHFEGKSKMGKRILYIIHGIHHETPMDKSRIITPPIPGVFIVFFFFIIVYLLLGKHSFVFTAGWLTGYLLYSFIHYHLHLSKPIRGFKFLWTHHAQHHWFDSGKAFGVSSPMWDYIFCTMPEKSIGKKELDNEKLKSFDL